MSYMDIMNRQIDFFDSQRTKPISFRREQLNLLKSVMKKYEERILTALAEDFHKPRVEAFLSEISVCYDEIDYFLKNIKRWYTPKRVKGPSISPGAAGYIMSEPYGVTLIISPWNYPFQLSIYPLIGALAAGNCVVLKPSEYTPAISSLLAEMVADNFDAGLFTVYEGGVAAAKELLSLKWDYIFYTGSASVGKEIMLKAAERLIPVTLELGGKCPCIIDKTADVKQTAKRVMWGKLVNAGQSCIAPDYLLVDKAIKDELLDELSKAVVKLYGENPAVSDDYCQIINVKHTERLKKYLECGKIFLGGEVDVEKRYIAPTIMVDVDMNSEIMRDEIFGPILPVFEFEELDDAIKVVNELPKPLALYFFAKDKAKTRKVLTETSSGGVCINNTIVHVISPQMPFGGVGSSGMGSYRGKKSFDTFTHYKSVLKEVTLFDLPFKYPPYSRIGEKIVRFIKRQ